MRRGVERLSAHLVIANRRRPTRDAIANLSAVRTASAAQAHHKRARKKGLDWAMWHGKNRNGYVKQKLRKGVSTLTRSCTPVHREGRRLHLFRKPGTHSTLQDFLRSRLRSLWRRCG